MQKNNDSILLSCEVSLFRNLSSSVFPNKLSEKAGNSVFCKVANAAEECFGARVFKLSELDDDDISIMKQKGLLNAAVLERSDISGVAILGDESVFVRINGQNHVEECCNCAFELFENAFSKVDQFDSTLDKKLGFAFDPNFGFLTSNMQDMGTAMHAKVQMFLPALVLSGKIEGVVEAIKKMGLSLSAEDDFHANNYVFELSNTKTLGVTENDILAKTSDAAKKIFRMEKEERKELACNPSIELKDMIFRSFAVLCGAFALEYEEFVEMLSKVKLGAILGLLRFKTDEVFDKLFVAGTSGALVKIAGHGLSKENEKIFRADYVSRMLKQNSI